jgi:L-ascorbate metabolism protein UlaG (beta-lactamase superfamily)
MSSKITIMGHAGLFIESAGERILVDPILRTTPLASGSMTHSYGRSLELDAMPKPTQLVITHGHLDHFDPESLRKLDRDVAVVVPHDPAMQHVLDELGFRRVHAIEPWQRHELGALQIIPTPSHAGVIEWGVLFELADGRYLHPADSEPSLADARRIRAEHGPIDVASMKFQPAAPGSAVMRDLGAHFDKREVADWLQCVLELSPRFVFPYASGLRYCGRHAWLNRHAFPFRSAEMADLLRPALPSDHVVSPVRPGDVLELSAGAVRHTAQASPFIRLVDDGASEPDWQPFDPSTLTGLDSDAEREELESRFEQLLVKEIVPWIARGRDREHSLIQSYVQCGVVYQLVIHLGADQTLDFAIDFRGRMTLTAERHPLANYFAHLSGRGLLDVLRGELGPELFYMSGDVRQYEKIIALRDGEFAIPAAQGWALFEQLGEPITHYLRHRGA